MIELTKEVSLHHQRFDRTVAFWISRHRQGGGEIFCQQGCKGCCSLVVNCQFTEAVLIASALDREQKAKVSQRVESLAELTREVSDLPSYLRLYRNAIGFCPFLDPQGSCTIYPRRPLSCRSLLATKESRWCSTDFSTLSSEEKQKFIEDLDPSVNALPMHYVAMTQDLGREMETLLALQMQERVGFSIYGNMLFLVHLENELSLSSLLATGKEEVTGLLQSKGYLAPLLITID